MKHILSFGIIVFVFYYFGILPVPFLITAIILNSLVKIRNNWRMPVKALGVDSIIIDKRKIYFHDKNDINCYYLSDIFRMPTFLSRIIYFIFGPLHTSSSERKIMKYLGISPDYYYSLGDCFAFSGFFLMTFIAITHILR